MNPDDRYIKRGKFILSISFTFLIMAISLFVLRNSDLVKEEDYTIAYETIDIKAMGVAKVSNKKAGNDNIYNTVVANLEKKSNITEVALTTKTSTPSEDSKVEETSAPPKLIWRLPTEQGYITQYAHYGHIALDITSARGTNERIYPVADGVITSIYHDSYGAKIITIRHNMNGQIYTSQYVHLSWYADGIYVGQPVTTDTVLGGMGRTGIATGIHLHLTVMDCDLYNAGSCGELGAFYNYGRMRVNQGFKGLDSLMYVPYSWYSR